MKSNQIIEYDLIRNLSEKLIIDNIDVFQDNQ